MVGWKLVDSNGVEIDPRTAAMVFPTGSAIQPLTDGPALAASGGGWYLNVGSPTPPASGSSLYAARANPSEVYFDWFHQSTLVPPTLSGNLKVGAYNDYDPTGWDDINVAAPSYNVVYSPITSVPPSFRFDALGDPGFELVSVGDGQFQYRPTGSPWSFSGNAGISANNSGFTSGNPPAPQGTQVAFLQATGSFSQSFSGWTAGTYDLTFEAAQRANSGTSQQDFNVLVDGVLVGHFQPSGTSYQSFTTAPFTISERA